MNGSVAYVDAAVNPEGGDIDDRTRGHLDRLGVSVRRLHVHDAAPGVAEIDLGAVGAGVDMAPRHEELVADFSGLERARAEDELVRRHPVGTEFVHLVGKVASAFGHEPVERFRVARTDPSGQRSASVWRRCDRQVAVRGRH